MRSRLTFAAALSAGFALFLPSCSESHGPGGGGGGTDSLAALACANAQSPTPVAATLALGDSTPVIGSEKVFYRITLRPSTVVARYLGFVRLGIPAAGRYRLFLDPGAASSFGISGADGKPALIDTGYYPDTCPDKVHIALDFDFQPGNQTVQFGTGDYSVVGLMIAKP